MKVLKVKKKGNLYTVVLKPNLVERLFGVKTKIKEYKSGNGEFYTFGGGGVYYDKKGRCIGNNHYIQIAIDRYRNSW